MNSKATPTLTNPLVCTPLARGSVLSDAEAADLSARLKAIADPTRLKLVTYLLNAPDHHACICDLAPMVGLTDATVNHHLTTLAAAGIVTKERRGMNVYYSVTASALHDLARVLSPGCC